MFSSIEDALIDYQKGKIIIVVDDEDRENEGDMICNSNFATPENINFMAQNARGLICVAIDKSIADKMQLLSFHLCISIAIRLTRISRGRNFHCKLLCRLNQQGVSEIAQNLQSWAQRDSQGQVFYLHNPGILY